MNHLNRIEKNSNNSDLSDRCIDENPCTHAQARFAAANEKKIRNFDRIARLLFEPC